MKLKKKKISKLCTYNTVPWWQSGTTNSLYDVLLHKMYSVLVFRDTHYVIAQ